MLLKASNSITQNQAISTNSHTPSSIFQVCKLKKDNFKSLLFLNTNFRDFFFSVRDELKGSLCRISIKSNFFEKDITSKLISFRQELQIIYEGKFFIYLLHGYTLYV